MFSHSMLIFQHERMQTCLCINSFQRVGCPADRFMTPADLLHSLVAVYPAEGSNAERSGALQGDRRVRLPQIPDMMKVCTATQERLLDFAKRCWNVNDDSKDCRRYADDICSKIAIGLLCQNSDFFKLFDTDGDGYISFSEYLMIVTFLAIPLEACS